MRRKALATSIGLSLFFLVVYGGCNWITGQRRDVHTFYFQWERSIPFVPFLILPYLSIDLFFVTAPFLCRSKIELRTFATRVSIAIIVAGICFLLVPLRFAFPRPHANGWTGSLFDWFRGIDAPYNLLPSLHAALGLFLFDIFARHTRGAMRALVVIWFVLIGISPILTHQHHVSDIGTGFALAGYCFYFFREPVPRRAIRPNVFIGLLYFAGAAALIPFAVFRPLLGVCLIWPFVSLALVAVAYFGLGPRIFRKTEGKLPVSTLFVLGPCLVGQYVSFLYYLRQCAPWSAVTSSVLIGRRLRSREAEAACRAGVTAVLDLTAEFAETKPFRVLLYGNIPVLDLTAPTLEQLEQMARFIMQHSERGKVYVHCKVGYSRSAAAVAAYLMSSGQANGMAEAVGMIRATRPTVVIRPEVISALAELETYLHRSLPAEAFLLASAPARPS